MKRNRSFETIRQVTAAGILVRHLRDLPDTGVQCFFSGAVALDDTGYVQTIATPEPVTAQTIADILAAYPPKSKIKIKSLTVNI